MKKLIIYGEWKPGTKIPSENEIAQSMDVSRVSVRGALQKLAGLAIIESRHGEGTFICELSASQQMNNLLPMMMLSNPDITYMNEFRKILECSAAKLAAQRAAEEVIVKMEHNFMLLNNANEAKQDCVELDLEFHMLVAEASGNPFILQTEIVMKDYFVHAIQKYKTIMGSDPSVFYHRKILDAIIAKDGKAAYQIMEEHLTSNDEAMYVQMGH